jgi:hypothetical protein
VSLESRDSAPPRRLGAPIAVGTRSGQTRGHLLRGIAWGLLFAAPVWVAVVTLALLVLRARW